MKKEYRNAIAKNISVTIVCVVLGIIIALQYKTIDANNRLSVEEINTIEGLKSALIQEQTTKESLQNEVLVLTEKNRRLEDSALDQQLSILKEEYDRALVLSGLKDVKGDGVIITVGDNPNESVSDLELLDLINTLKSVDAQAISINEERVVAMSEIKLADNYIIINGRPVIPPYTVKVIGDGEMIEKALSMTGGMLQNWETYGLYMGIKQEKDILIPKVKEDSSSIEHDKLKPAQ